MFSINMELFKKMRKEQIRKEKLLFLALCSESDRQRINGEQELQVNDFDRICYLLDSLGLENFLLHFENTYGDLLEQLGNQILTSLDDLDEKGIEQECYTRVQWLQDFCMHLPTPELAEHFKELFNI